MPHLLIFAPCETFLINDTDKTLSLITILDRITVAAPKGTPISEDSSVPQRWYACTLWSGVTQEAGKRFEQRISFVLPNGGVAFEVTAEFESPGWKHQHVQPFSSFPVGIEGTCSLELALRESGEPEWKVITSFPMEIKHIEQAGDDESADEE